MKTIMILAVVGSALLGCGKSGGSDGDSVSAQSVSGSYAVKTTRTNGDIVIIFATISNGQFEISDYKFTSGNMANATYVKWISTDVVSGNVHNVSLTHATCPTLNGITGPITQAFPITPLNNNKILLHSNGANADIMMDKIDSIPQALANMGTYLATEVTDCTATF